MQNDLDTQLASSLDALVRDHRSHEEFTSDLIATLKPEGTIASRGRRPRRAQFAAAIVAATVIGSTALAVAAPGTLHGLFGDDPTAPANRLPEFQANVDPMDMSAFDEVRPYDTAPSALVALLLAAGTTQQTRTSGKVVKESARVVLTTTARGVGTLKLAAAPTTSGNVCLAWFYAGEISGATCIDHLDDKSPVSAMAIGSDDSTAVIGIALDDVQGVSVRTESGGLEPATMGTNAYAWTGTRADNAVSLIAKLTDGSTRDVRIPGIEDINR